MGWARWRQGELGAGKGEQEVVVLGFLSLTDLELGRRKDATEALADLRTLVMDSRLPWYRAGKALPGEFETALGEE